MPLFDDCFMMVGKKKRAMILKRKMCEDNSEKNNRGQTQMLLLTNYSLNISR